MKALLLLTAITTLTMVGCVAGPYESSYSYGGSNYYQPAPQPQHYYQPAPVYRTFYDLSAPSCPTVYVPENNNCVQYRNHSSRSVIVRHPNGRATVVGKSWD